MGGEAEESRNPAAGTSRNVAVAMRHWSLIRQSSLVKLCPEPPLHQVPCTQAVAYSSQGHHEGMQAQMGAWLLFV